MAPSWGTRIFRGVLASAAFAVLLSGKPALAQTPSPTPNLVCGSQNIAVTSVSSPILYTDSSESLLGNYVGYSITNNTGADIPDLWVQLENFSGGVITLADFENGLEHVGALANGATVNAFFYLKASSVTATNQSFNVVLYPSDPTVSFNICSEGFSLTSQNAISSGNNTVSSVTFSPNPPELGGILTVTVTGVTGTIGSAGIFSHTPAALTGWRADIFKLASTQISMTGGNTLTSSNTLYLSGLGSSTTNYTVTSSFRVVGALGSTMPLYPISYISSGAQIKHTSTTGYGSIAPIAIAANAAKIDSITFAPSTLDTSGGTTTVTVTFSNSGTGAVRMDELNITLPTSPDSVTYTSSTSTFGGSSISNPTLTSNILSWIGSFNIPAGGTATLTFDVVLPATTGGYTFSAIGLVDGTQIDTTVSTADNLPASGTVYVGPTPTPSEAPTESPTPAESPTASETPDITPTPENTPTPEATASPSPTVQETPTDAPTASETPTPTESASPTASETPEPTLSPSPTVSPSPTASETPEPTLSPSPTATPTETPTPSASPSASPTMPPPVVSPPSNGPTVNPNPPINGTGPANTQIIVYIDGNPAGTTTTDGSGNWTFIPSQRLPAGVHPITAYAVDSNSNLSPVSNTEEIEIRAEVPLDFDGDGITDITTRRIDRSGIKYDSLLSTTDQHQTATIIGSIPSPADYDGDGTWDYGAFGLDQDSVSWRIKLSTTGQSVHFNHGKRGDLILVGCRLVTPYQYSAAYVRNGTIFARDFDSGSILSSTIESLRRRSLLGCGDVTGDGRDELIFSVGTPGLRSAGIVAIGMDGVQRVFRRHAAFPRSVIIRQASTGTQIVTAIYWGSSMSRKTSLVGLGAAYDGPAFRLPGGNVDISSGIFIPDDHAVAGAYWTDGRMIKRRLLERGSTIEDTIQVPLGHSLVRPQRVYHHVFFAQDDGFPTTGRIRGKSAGAKHKGK